MKVKSKRLSRRKFLKKVASGSAQGISAAGLTTSVLTGCAALDRYFEIEKFKYDKEVLIFGAGIAGLTTAYYLKKNKIPYRIFEASMRTGGRIITQHSADEEIYYDLGASQFDEYDMNVLNLVKDLNIETDDGNSNSFKNTFAFINHQMLFPFRQILQSETKSFQNWNKELIRIKKSDEDSEGYDWLTDSAVLEYEKIFLNDILKDAKINFLSKTLLKNWAEFYYQKPEAEITFLSWLMLLENETLQNKKLRLKNGMEELTIHLTQRVNGVIPNYNLQLPARLLEIQRSNENWLCQIQTQEGIKKISSPYVVLAMPFSELKYIKGIENIFVNKDFVNLIKQSTNRNSITAVAQLKNKNFKRPKQVNDFLCIDNRTFKFKLDNHFAVFNFNNANDLDWFINEKNLALNFLNSKDFSFVSSVDWSQIKFINGSQMSLKPKEPVLLKQSLDADWAKSSLQLAGDYMISPFRSHLNDTIQTAINAVENIKATYFERIKEAT